MLFRVIWRTVHGKQGLDPRNHTKPHGKNRTALNMIIEEITVTAFQQHTRIVGCEKTRRAICIDPGDGSDEIVQAIDKSGLELQAIACTHAHMDHIGGVTSLKKLKPAAKIIIHPADQSIYDQLPNQPAWIGIPRAQWPELGFDYEPPPKIDEPRQRLRPFLPSTGFKSS